MSSICVLLDIFCSQGGGCVDDCLRRCCTVVVRYKFSDVSEVIPAFIITALMVGIDNVRIKHL